jgi:16S rRNA (cytidine1402-2'-O)-methyltransferase
MNIQRSFQAESSAGTLYVVGTPIGNLEDITYRAVRTLREADMIAAEDTRQTRKLLTHFEIATRLVSYHEHNKAASGPELIRLLKEGTTIALVSDAGLPGISDPGADLVRDAVREGIAVVPIPGPNAALSALIVSGLPTDRFLFAGFPPRAGRELRDWLATYKHRVETLLLYESPHRVAKTLAAMLEAWGDRRVAVARELTKRYEEVARGRLSEAIAMFAERPPVGEYCVVVEGADPQAAAAADAGGEGGEEAWWAALSVTAHVARYEEQTGSRKDAMKRAAADRGVSKRDIYAQYVAEGGGDPEGAE